MKQIRNLMNNKTFTVWSSGLLAVLGFVLHKTQGYVPFTIVVMLLGTAIAGIPILLRAWQALRYKVVGIDTLVSIAVIGAVLIGEYWEAAAVSFLFMLGDYLEARTIQKTRSNIRALMDLAPKIARVRREGVEMELAPEEVVLGDIVIIKPGEHIPVDGQVMEGQASINQAAITGESIPLLKQVGDSVFAGTVAENGYLLVQAEKVGEDTTFARILHLVEEAQDKKAKAQKTLEKFARWYTPAIIVLSLALYLFTGDIRLSLTLLVISCPGALVISTPVSIVAGIGNGARHGVLIKGGEVMEKLGTVRAIAFDKTGTLTQGKPKVTRFEAFGITEQELLHLAATGEAYSEHPLAQAILLKAREAGITPATPDNFEQLAGMGLRFSLDKKQYTIGNDSLMSQEGISLANHQKMLESEQDKGQTVVFVAGQGRVLGLIAIADTLREGVPQLIRQLKAMGIRHTVMLTGDNKRAAKAIASQAGLDGYYSELLPEDKVAKLQAIKEEYGSVVMVGDGVNDAPALAMADLGIAVGGIGADVAMETADAVLMSQDIRKLRHALGLSRATVRNIRQNIIFALLVVALLISGVLFGAVDMSIGMLVHEASVLLVIINAMRLLGYGTMGKKDA